MVASKLIERFSVDRFDGELLTIVESRVEPYLIVNPAGLTIEVESGVEASVVLVHNSVVEGSVALNIGESAALNVVDLFDGECATTKVCVKQLSRSKFNILTLQLSSSRVDYEINMDGSDAESRLNGLFMVSGGEHSRMGVVMRHNVSDCRSYSFVKGVAGGKSTGEFHGLVYVARDAQRTDAQQQNRNLELSDGARIISKPELEIYADDVKCSHGVTMGQMNSEAILYMRQRGLSEVQARRLQTEGFVNDIVMCSPIESLQEVLFEGVVGKLENI